MIILDSDVLSAAIKPGTPEHLVVLPWLDRQPVDTLGITTITLFEVLGGIERIDPGRRRSSMLEAFELAIAELFPGRIFPFDEAAARASAQLYGARRRVGRPVGSGDTQIAGIALARQAAIATRNVRHFGQLSIPVVNPWEA
jgi:hypothetical protein